MNDEQEDFAAKLTLIEFEAKLLLEDLEPGVMRDRVQHIATVARLLRLRLDVASTVILPAPPQRKDAAP
ncbi:MAG TPA: hypothetical protein VFB93_20405 [Burkholderiales bacterium]|nr:hypothetical protein [Burkholderiales bacterium]